MSILNNEVTTPRQVLNGTRAFFCTRTGATYLSYASGYVRRLRSPKVCTKAGIYQLNRKTRYKTVSFKSPFPITRTKRIMIPNEADRLALIERRAESYLR